MTTHFQSPTMTTKTTTTMVATAATTTTTTTTTCSVFVWALLVAVASMPRVASSFVVPTTTPVAGSVAVAVAVAAERNTASRVRQPSLLHAAAAPPPGASDKIPSWKDLAKVTGCDRHEQPIAVNGADYSSHPDLGGGNNNNNNKKPILYRERHGWCPYSERVWLALEAKGVDYDTIYIDNIYGRPSWYGGNTPQMKWEDGRVQSESMDLVREIDERYNNNNNNNEGDATLLQLYPEDIRDEVVNKSERAFRTIFPKKARPSSRAAFLFRYDGTPLWKNEFETTLRETDALLGETSASGPFFCGDRFTAADVCWAPFLERYAGQLPCLHEGLDPRCPETYPHLHRWYEAMEGKTDGKNDGQSTAAAVPAYACRIRGDPSSWRKVLTMAGFGNAGSVPPLVSERMDELAESERRPLSDAQRKQDQRLWDAYAATRPHVAASSNQEAASVLVRNRAGIARDVAKNYGGSGNNNNNNTNNNFGNNNNNNFGNNNNSNHLDEAMRSLAVLLCDTGSFSPEIVDACEERCGESLRSLAAFLDERMCVPRDMGALSAAHFKRF